MCAVFIAETLHLKNEVGQSPFPSRYIIYQSINQSINQSICGVEIYFASISKTVSRFFLFFSRFFLFFVFANPEFTVTKICDDNMSVHMVGHFQVAIGVLVDGTAIHCSRLFT